MLLDYVKVNNPPSWNLSPNLLILESFSFEISSLWDEDFCSHYINDLQVVSGLVQVVLILMFL
jgi:hypothetical protein